MNKLEKIYPYFGINHKRYEYQILLDKFKGNADILKLIEECILDYYGACEDCYGTTGVYPPKRNLLMKLKTDLTMNNTKGDETDGR